jgi:hypothetical protein
MVCGRCEMALTSELEKWGSLFFLFNWGSGNRNWFRRQSKANVIKNLNSIGFELLDDKENKTVERIKTESLTWYIIKRNN